MSEQKSIWTPEEDARLVEMRQERGKTFSVIAHVLGKTSRQCECRYKIIVNRDPRKKIMGVEPRERPCLRCHLPFLSPDPSRLFIHPNCRGREA